MTSLYYLPCKTGFVYLNITNKCMNNCLFCIKRNGSVFYGQNLLLQENVPELDQMISMLSVAFSKGPIEELVVCGMGEPLLLYQYVFDLCRKIKKSNIAGVSIRVDTSGLFWVCEQRLEILDCIDILSVSLNAENSQKYQELCQPTIQDAYQVLMDFLRNVKNVEEKKKKKNVHFPKIRLSIVDTSEEEFIPISGRKGYTFGTFSRPDYGKCKEIANKFGWPLIVKRLFRDSCDEVWRDSEVQDKLAARGIEIERCKQCTCRH